MLLRLMPAICSIDPFALRNLSHIFSICGGLLFVLVAIMLVFLLRFLTRRKMYHWLFVCITFIVSIGACYLAIRTNHDLVVCDFGPTDFFSTYQLLSLLVCLVTMFFFVLGTGIVISGIWREKHL